MNEQGKKMLESFSLLTEEQKREGYQKMFAENPDLAGKLEKMAKEIGKKKEELLAEVCDKVLSGFLPKTEEK